MKKDYPSYEDINEVFKALPKHNQEVINSYIEYCKKDAKESTLQKYFNKIVQIADVTQKPLDSLNLDDVNKFLVLLNLSNRSTDTRNDIKKVLKRFLKWKFDDWSLRFKELRDVRQKKKTSSEKLTKKDLLTKEELEFLLRGAESLRYKAMITLLFESASRPEEMLKLKWKDIDFKEEEVFLNSSKTGEARPVPLKESIMHLKRYYQEYPFPNVTSNDFVFPSTDREKHTSNQVVQDYLNKLALATIKKHITPYTFRHTRLQELRPLLSPEAYERIAGHSYQTGLDFYGHLDNKDAKEEMLSRVYHIEELTTEEKNEIKQLRKEVAELKEDFNLQVKWIQQKMTPKELNSAVALLRKLIEVKS